jgi:adenine-specific DNA-methyltransferase
MDGVRFPDNKESQFSRLQRISGNDGGIHAEGRWMTVAVAFGPQYGPVTAKQVEDVIRSAYRRGYDHLVVAGFSFGGPAQAIINESKHPKLRIHIANIRPDVNAAMDGLLKQKPGSPAFHGLRATPDDPQGGCPSFLVIGERPASSNAKR